MAGKKFRFPLDQVLTLRAQATEEAMRQHAQALRARRDQQDQLAALDEALDEATRATPATGTINPLALQRHAVHRLTVQDARVQAEQQLQRLEKQEAAARRAVLDARQPEEALRTLRTHQQAAHQQAAATADQAFLDEQATLRYRRSSF